MKKLKKLLFVLLLIVTCFSSVEVFASAPSTFTLEKELVPTINGVKEAYFRTSDGRYAYCITQQKTGAPPKTTFKYAGDYNNGGILYLAEKEVSSKTRYLEIQLAMWQYKDGYLPPVYRNNPNSSYTKSALALSNDANSHSNYGHTNPSIKLDKTSSVMNLTRDGKYYQSEAFYVNLNNMGVANIKVDGAEIIDQSGNIKTTIKNNEKFYVRVNESSITSSKNYTITLSGSGKINVLRKYVATSGDWQELVVIYPEDKEATTTVTTSVTPIKRVCQQHNGKYYGKNGTIVTSEVYKEECVHTCTKYDGKYYGKNGTVVTESTYKDECIHTCEIYDGKYYGKNGTVVTEETYKDECVHKCVEYDGSYYGKEGNIVTLDQYKSECMHFCEEYNGNYYDKNGFIVNKDEYDKQCTTVVPVPDTASGSLIGLLTIVFGSSLLGGVVGYLNHKKTKKANI